MIKLCKSTLRLRKQKKHLKPISIITITVCLQANMSTHSLQTKTRSLYLEASLFPTANQSGLCSIYSTVSGRMRRNASFTSHMRD
jgi:hypothetical protein